jgi:FeS assembly protein IscX
MMPDDSHIHNIAGSILRNYNYLFPSTYPDIPLNLNMLKEAMAETGFFLEEEKIPEFMEDIELQLAAMVPLNWNNYGTIAILLNKTHPEEDLIAISLQRITELVRELPNFNDAAVPDEDTLDSIIYTWISLTDEYPGFTEDEAWS